MIQSLTYNRSKNQAILQADCKPEQIPIWKGILSLFPFWIIIYIHIYIKMMQHIILEILLINEFGNLID